MEVSSLLHGLAVLPPGKNPFLYPLNRRLGGPQRRSGGFRKEKNVLPQVIFSFRDVRSRRRMLTL
jgi:hypothetical protein